MKDALGDRMKANYEGRSRMFLARRTYTIIRIDGKAFHTYTRGLKRPFDDGLMQDMDQTAAYLCKNIMGSKFAFVQSDEISILLCDFEEIGTQAWFDNNIQKMVSVSASMAAAKFNQLRMSRATHTGNGETQFKCLSGNEIDTFKLAEFDARVFQIPQKSEVENYFIWRQQDTTRNSISSVAQSLYSSKQLHGMNTDQQQEMIFQKGINWNDYAPKYKRGRLILKENYLKEPDEEDKGQSAIRTRWVSCEVPIFTQERAYLQLLIPDNF